jgi:hypothetical protein
MRFFLASLVVLAATPSCGGNVVVPGADAGNNGCTSNACMTGDPICVVDSDCLAGEYCDTTTGKCKGTIETSCQQCACIYPLSMGGCANLCKTNGTATPNFCDGVPALPECKQCLLDHCGSLAPPPDPSNPAACM